MSLLKAKIDATTEAIIEATRASIYQEGLAIMAISVRKTPVRYGRLRASAFVHPPKRELEAVVGYGVEYALPVHEMTEANFTTGEARFLEKAMNERSRGYEKRLAKRIRINALRGIRLGQVHRDFPERPKDEPRV